MIPSCKASSVAAMAALSVAVLSGCTTADLAPARAPSPAATGTSAPVSETDPVRTYVQVVNGLCDQTMTAVRLLVPAGYAADTPVAKYRVDAPELRKIYDTFDQHFAAVPVPPPAQAAAATFKAYVVESDRTKAAAIAATSSQASFAAEFTRQLTYWDNNPVTATRDQAGFAGSCSYR